MRIVAAQFEYRLQFVDRLPAQSALQQLGLHVVQPDLFELVDGDGDVHHHVGMADRLGDAEQDFAVVHLQRHADAQRPEHALDDFDQFDLAQQRAGADHVDVALVEFAVTAFLRPVGAPYGLDLVALEGKRQFALVLYDIARERHREVVTEPLLADFRRLPHLIAGQAGGVVARIEYLEEELVALVAVFAQQGRKVLHRGGFERREAVGAEHAPDRIENILAAHHLRRGEVARTFGYGRFLLSHIT